ncbi:MAG TPA: aconitase family protein [Candidatus Polarisedimenticolaceae bacterium]|nr:aconitase family protein [Candidatus Polarisedimenticolaceae bacterium]
MTRTEEIVAAHAVGWRGGAPPASGDVVWIRPDRLMTHDNTSAVIARFRASGRAAVADPRRLVVALDHDVQNRSPEHRAKYAAIEAFARSQGIEFHAAGSGIGHQLMIERGHVRPGGLVAAADSHANMYGAEGALGVPVTRSDAAAIWASGLFWWEIPPVVRVRLEGRLPAGSTGKDAALVLCALYPDDANGSSVEFSGPGLATLAADDRLTLANLTTEWGAAACVVDDGAAGPREGYTATITLDLAEVGPHVAGPDTLTSVSPLAAIAPRKIAIRKAYLVSCAGARASDLAAAAAALEGGRVAPGVRLYLSAASAAVEREARAEGSWDALVAAGATVLPSGCGPCIGLGEGLLADGETGISASNRNFKGRMGSPKAACWLASPAVVAASARAGFITGPGGMPARTPPRAIVRHASRAAAVAGPRSPRRVEGRLVTFLRDGVDTDALCPARFVYADATPPEQLASAVLEALDPSFAPSVRPGDILVAGARFGIGSSREQAVLALRALGIAAVVAASLAPAFRRNAWNNGLLAVEAPAFVEALVGRGTATIPGGKLVLDLGAWVARLDDVQAAIVPLPQVALDLLDAGGLDAFVRGAAP